MYVYVQEGRQQVGMLLGAESESGAEKERFRE